MYIYLKVTPPIPTHHVPLSTRSYTCGTWSCAWIYAHLSKTVHSLTSQKIPVATVTAQRRY